MKKDKYFIQKICAFDFFNAFILLYPVYALFFLQSGASTSQISFLFIFWSVTVVLANAFYPKFARIMTQKNIVLLGQMLKAICFVVWLSFPNFYAFLFGFILWGFQWSFLSRVYEGLVYNYLKSQRQESRYLRLCSYKKAANHFGYLLSGMGSLLLVYGYNVLGFLSVLSLIISFAILFNIHFPKKVNFFFEKPKPALKIIHNAVQVLRQYPIAMYHVILLTCVVGLSYLDEFFGLVGIEIGVPEKYVGFIYIGALLVHTVFSYFAYRFEKISNRTLYILVILSGILFIGISTFYSLFALILLFLFFALYSIIDVLLFSRIQSELKTKAHRSTFLGFYSLLEQITSIISYAAMMISSGISGGTLRYGFSILGTMVIILGLLYLSSAFAYKTYRLNK